MKIKTESRKLSHIKIGLKKKIESNRSPGFDDISIIHNALPEIDKNEIDTSIVLFDHVLKAPIIIGPMTGGTPESRKINKSLAIVAEKLGLGIGVGSQRAALEDKRLISTYDVVRKNAPSALLFANLGCSQLIDNRAVETAKAVVDMIDADAIYIHLNALQESIQHEGQTYFRGVMSKIKEVVEALDVPVMVKETGAGISSVVAEKLVSIGVSGIDISGTGGTSWAGVEYYRAKKISDSLRERLGETFWEWGIPTVVSLIEVTQSASVPIIASGGIRTGLHIAKSSALGATACSIALPLIRSADISVKELQKVLETIVEELKTAMFLSGAKTIQELGSIPIVITGRMHEWLSQRGFDTEQYARRL